MLNTALWQSESLSQFFWQASVCLINSQFLCLSFAGKVVLLIICQKACTLVFSLRINKFHAATWPRGKLLTGQKLSRSKEPGDSLSVVIKDEEFCACVRLLVCIPVAMDMAVTHLLCVSTPVISVAKNTATAFFRFFHVLWTVFVSFFFWMFPQQTSTGLLKKSLMLFASLGWRAATWSLVWLCVVFCVSCFSNSPCVASARACKENAYSRPSVCKTKKGIIVGMLLSVCVLSRTFYPDFTKIYPEK